MKLNHAALWLFLLLFSGTIAAQEKVAREIDIHKNVKLIEMAMPPDMPEELKANYQLFLPLFIETLKTNTADQAPETAITVRLTPGLKEVGAAKTKRIFVQVAAFKRDSKSEFIANLLLHSYLTGETVNKEEIEQFLAKQILRPMGS